LTSGRQAIWDSQYGTFKPAVLRKADAQERKDKHILKSKRFGS